MKSSFRSPISGDVLGQPDLPLMSSSPNRTGASDEGNIVRLVGSCGSSNNIDFVDVVGALLKLRLLQLTGISHCSLAMVG